MNPTGAGRNFHTSPLSLNGAWDFCAWAGELPPAQVPPDLAWQVGAYRVDPYPGAGDQPPQGLLRRRLRVENRPGLRAWLRFARAGGPAVFFLNGRRFYASPETWLPVEMDLHDHAVLDSSSAANELVIWRGPGQAALQGAELAYLPAISIPDLVVRPRRGNLDVEVTLENRTWDRFEGRLEIFLLQDGQPLVLLASVDAALERGLLTTLALRASWQGSRVWSLDDPWLYTVEACLSGPAGLLDARRVRFGLRDARRADGDWWLNGQKIGPARPGHLPGADPSAALAHLKETGPAVLRLNAPYPLGLLDLADELGLLVEIHLADWAPGGPLLADPAFSSPNEDHLRRLARRERSHPSLAGWFLDGPRPALRHLAEVLRAMDSTRPIFESEST